MQVLKSFWDLREEIHEFCVKKGNDIPQLSDADWIAVWIADLGFAVDVTALINELIMSNCSAEAFLYMKCTAQESCRFSQAK